MARLTKLQAIVTEVYANGGSLVVSADGKRIGLKAEPGGAANRLYREIKENKQKLLEVLTGDPLAGPGWEARTALFREALRYLDSLIERDGLNGERATKALCQQEPNDKLNKAWVDGTFDEFRAALKDYVRTGLMAARGLPRKEVSF